MLVVHVHVHVLADAVEAFRRATLVNAAQSLKEPGIARFDVIQQQDDPTRFILVEAYRTAEAVTAHKETAHYAAWRDAAMTLMAEPRYSLKYANVFPDDARYGTPGGGPRP
jgi:(4S)-4-hydroxy-5-phosphonooxypentane-2,3-dione isomerase